MRPSKPFLTDEFLAPGLIDGFIVCGFKRLPLAFIVGSRAYFAKHRLGI